MRALIASLSAIALLLLASAAASASEAAEPANAPADSARFVKPDQAMASSLTALTVVYVGLVVLVMVYVTFLVVRLRKASKQVSALRSEVDTLKTRQAEGKSPSPLA